MRYVKAKAEKIPFKTAMVMLLSIGKSCSAYDIIMTWDGRTYACYKVDDGYYVDAMHGEKMYCWDVEGFSIPTYLYCWSIEHHHDEPVV